MLYSVAGVLVESDRPANPAERLPRYWAFVCYARVDNKEPGRDWATWLQRQIEDYIVPKSLVGTTNRRGERVPSRIYPVCRDESSFSAGAELSEGVRAKLVDSRVLVVLCSENSARSKYVDHEIRVFREHVGDGIDERVAPVLLDVNLDQDTMDREPVFPAALVEPLDTDGDGIPDLPGLQPLAADLRLPGVGFTNPRRYDAWLAAHAVPDSWNAETYQRLRHQAVLKVISAILAVDLDELERRDQEEQNRQQTRLTQLAVGVSLLSFPLLVLVNVFIDQTFWFRVEFLKLPETPGNVVLHLAHGLHQADRAFWQGLAANLLLFGTVGVIGPSLRRSQAYVAVGMQVVCLVGFTLLINHYDQVGQVQLAEVGSLACEGEIQDAALAKAILAFWQHCDDTPWRTFWQETYRNYWIALHLVIIGATALLARRVARPD